MGTKYIRAGGVPSPGLGGGCIFEKIIMFGGLPLLPLARHYKDKDHPEHTKPLKIYATLFLIIKSMLNKCLIYRHFLDFA